MSNLLPMQTRTRQRGIALPTVLVLLLLSIISVLGAFRSGYLNEIMVGNVSDYNRAKTAAEALIRDAEMDIRGRRPPYTTVQADGTRGFPCRPNPAGSAVSQISMPNFIGCRNPTLVNEPFFPFSADQYTQVIDAVVANSPTERCWNGICVPLDTIALANIEDNLATMIPFGATYGQYTRADLPALVQASGNPILDATTTARGWYWVEIFTYSTAPPSGVGASIGAALVPGNNAPFVYRITAVARGLKDGTRVVIRSIFIPFPGSQDT
jgi:type IV pilus assembly protein PilX